MLPKQHRLHQDQDIKRLLKTGKTFFLPQLSIKYQKNKLTNSRFAFVVSTKVDKRSVIRHKLARRLRAITHKLSPQILGGYDVIIMAKQSALALDYPTLEKQLIFAFDKIKILKINSVKTN